MPTFACFLDRLEPAVELQELRVNPRAFLQSGTSIPAPLARRVPHRGRLRPGYPLVWVEQPVTGMLVPYWIPHAWARTLLDVFAGDLAPDRVERPIRAALVAAGLLQPRKETVETSAVLAAARIQLARAGYANVAGLLPLGQYQALRCYCRELLASSQVAVGDSQCVRRCGEHDEGLARFWHHQLTGAIELIAGAPIKPSYTYFAGYLSEASLDAHVDREQCELTVSLLVDFEPAPESLSPWPLIIEGEHGDIAIHQALGDALVFRGRELRHRRDALGPGQSSTSILFHYVPAGFSGPLR